MSLFSFIFFFLVLVEILLETDTLMLLCVVNVFSDLEADDLELFSGVFYKASLILAQTLFSVFSL